MRKKKILKVMGKMKTWSMNRKFFPQAQISIYISIFFREIELLSLFHVLLLFIVICLTLTKLMLLVLVVKNLVKMLQILSEEMPGLGQVYEDPPRHSKTFF